MLKEQEQEQIFEKKSPEIMEMFVKKLAKYMFEQHIRLTQIFENKIYDVVLQRVEYHLVNNADFERLLSKTGFEIDPNDLKACFKILKPFFRRDSVDVGMLNSVLEVQGIYEVIPISDEGVYDYKPLNANAYRLINNLYKATIQKEQNIE